MDHEEARRKNVGGTRTCSSQACRGIRYSTKMQRRIRVGVGQSRGRTSASISKSESVKSAIKSVDTSALDRSGSDDESMDDPPRTVSRQDTAGKPKSKRMKIGSNIKKNKPEIDDLEKEKTQVKKDPIRIFELKKGDLSVKVTNWGAILVSVVLPDKNGLAGSSLAKEDIKPQPVEGSFPLSDSECTGSNLSITVVGASGDLAKKKIFPALFALYYEDWLPENFLVFGYARTKMTDEELRNMISKTLT